MKMSIGWALLGSLILLCGSGSSVFAQKKQWPIAPRCWTSTPYPANPEAVLADAVIEWVKGASSENDLLPHEADRLKTPEGQKEIRKYLEKHVEFGSEEEKAYKFCVILKEFAADLDEEQQLKLNEQLKVRLTQPDSKRKKCMPFFCIFRICKKC